MINVTRLLCGNLPADQAAQEEWFGAPRRSSDSHPPVIWQITRRCNLRCVGCGADFRSRHDPAELTLEEMVRVVDGLSASRVPSVLLTGGEPMLHPHFFDVAGYAIAKGLRVSAATNGTRIDSHAAERLKDLGLSCIGISLDGTGGDPGRYRGRIGAFKKTVCAFRHCRGAGQQAALRIRMSGQNIQNLPQSLQFIEAEEIQHACFSHSLPDADDAPTAAEIRSALRTIADATLRWSRLGSQRAIFTTGQPADGAYFWMMMRRRDAKRAEAIWRSLRHPSNRKVPAPPGIARIDSYGDVRPGPSQPDRILGSLKEQPFREIWERRRRGIGAPDLADFQRCTNCRFQEICEWESPERPLAGEAGLAPAACYLRGYEIAEA